MAKKTPKDKPYKEPKSKSKGLLSKRPSWKYRYATFTLPTFRSPLSSDRDIHFKDEIDHAFFLRCCELYRVLDLVDRNTEKLIDVYSKYRNRQQFTDILTFRYFDSEEAMVAQFDPRLAASLFFLFNLLYEMKIRLTYTDELPLTVKKDIDDSMITLKESWNSLTDGIQEKYSWEFKKFALPDAWQV